MNGGDDGLLRVRGTGIVLNSTCAKSDIEKQNYNDSVH